MKVSHLIALLICTVLTPATSYGQGIPNKDFILSQIRQVFQQVNDYNNYQVVTITNNEEFLGHATDNGGKLTGYYKGDSLKKMIEWIGLCNRTIQNEYYLDKGKLVFVYSIESEYKVSNNLAIVDYSKPDKVFRNRYYFANDKIIDAILSDKDHKKIIQEDAADFLSSSRKYLKLLNARR